MHNSQDGGPMNFDTDDDTPNENLLRGDCYGCHAMNDNFSLYTQTTDAIPQVMHTDYSNDLAAGNFKYIDLYGSNRGHNISDLTGTDTILYEPPGLLGFAHMGNINTDTLTCAGKIGCHGYRNPESPLPDGVRGAHHSNVDGKLDQADKPGNSYRFLMGVKGTESPDWEINPGSLSHNEYYGKIEPIAMSGCSKLGVSGPGCHSSEGVKPPDGTMSQFCATCHGNFHTLAFTGTDGFYDGIGDDAVSPFIRHPTDLALPNSGEYANYNTNRTYDPQVPIARTDEGGGLPDTPSQTVTPGFDAVMCLSCHRAHASEYPDMLRWNYSRIVAASGDDSEGGCFICHTTKDDV